jgi:uncharacterized protein DUF4386
VDLDDAAAAFLIILPLSFNFFFLLLSRLFDYPRVLRSPTATVLRRFDAGGVRLKLAWYGFMLTAVLLAPLVVLLGEVLARDQHAVVPVATTVGVLAAAVQFLGLARWPLLVPALARKHEDPASTPATREAAAVVFEAFHRYLGVAVGECLGYLLTGAWTALVGVAMLDASAFDPWLGWAGVGIGLLLVAGSLEFVGRFETEGWKPAEAIVPFAYVAWSVWLAVAGFVLLF